MGKRLPLHFNTEELAGHLEHSTGDGLDAFFGGSASPLKETAIPSKAEPTISRADPTLAERSTERTTERPNDRTTDRPNDRTTERPNDRTTERSNERLMVRKKVRHSFDIFADQLVLLEEIQHQIRRETAKKPKLGDLLQEALDAFIQRKLGT